MVRVCRQVAHRYNIAAHTNNPLIVANDIIIHRGLGSAFAGQ